MTAIDSNIAAGALLSYEVRIFNSRSGETLDTFIVAAADFAAALEEGQPRIERVALDAFDSGAEPEVEISLLD